MKHSPLALALLLGAGAPLAFAQQGMSAMPGMTMPQTHAAPVPQAPRPQPKPQPSPNRTPEPADPIPPDLRGMGHDQGDPRAVGNARSERNSVTQQMGQGSARPLASSDARSLTLPIETLQEPEAVGFHTGGDLPAPELLREVVSRDPMGMEAFVALADQHNPTLLQAQRAINRAAEQARQAGLPPDPELGYSGDHIRGGSYHGGEEGAFFSQVFVLGHKLALRRQVYLAEGQANRFALEVQRARVHDDVAAGFIHALAAQERVVVQDRLLKVALDAETNAHELERVGVDDASAVLTAEIAAEQAKIDFEQAQRDFLAAFGQVAALAGQAALPVHPLQGALVAPPVLDADTVVDADAADSPKVQQAQAQVAVAEARLRDAKRERTPNLNLKAGEWYSGEELGATTARAGWESFAEAGVQVPLWNRNQGNIGAAQAELDRAHGEVARTRLWTRHRAEPLAQQYASARFAAERYRTEMLPRARRAYQLEATKYQQMAEAYPGVLAAQHLLFTLQMGYLESLEREWQAALALQNYTLTDGLDGPMGVGDDSTTMNVPTGEGSPGGM